MIRSTIFLAIIFLIGCADSKKSEEDTNDLTDYSNESYIGSWNTIGTIEDGYMVFDRDSAFYYSWQGKMSYLIKDTVLAERKLLLFYRDSINFKTVAYKFNKHGFFITSTQIYDTLMKTEKVKFPSLNTLYLKKVEDSKKEIEINYLKRENKILAEINLSDTLNTVEKYKQIGYDKEALSLLENYKLALENGDWHLDIFIINERLRLYLKLFKLEEFKDLLEFSIKNELCDFESYYIFGQYYLTINLRDKAIEMLKKSIELDPGFPSSHYLLRIYG